jgi:outer membrane biosynthesis protein TonB
VKNIKMTGEAVKQDATWTETPILYDYTIVHSNTFQHEKIETLKYKVEYQASLPLEPSGSGVGTVPNELAPEPEPSPEPEPTEPTEPSKPSEPTKPEVPVSPTEPTTPEQPNDKADTPQSTPENTTTSTTQSNPEVVDAPCTPSKPDALSTLPALGESDNHLVQLLAQLFQWFLPLS